ncbi:Adenylate kinase [Pirellulimonas nuda]|uniref:Adenylate kinase n=1 Tax=Pirellulimonas nuda TaxID=2528009 RepID=A0A518DII4_9BACT|nr:adenylate kinase [Pirellulimonas nuda]QDU91289.1 Adenylate kinase [Pirellulimonas nuda]
MRIVFIGPPGAGKGTQSLKLAESLGVRRLSTGEVLRESRAAGEPLGQAAAEFLDRGELVPDDVVVRLVAERLERADCRRGYLFDGFPRTIEQARQLDLLLESRQAPLDAALEFVIPEDELFQRLSKRGRSDDSEETIRQRLRVYAALTDPLAEYYQSRGLLHRIDAVGTQQEVYARLTGALSTVKPADSDPKP